MSRATQHGPAAEAKAQSRGLQIIGVLAVLTVVEYLIAIGVDSSTGLVLMLTPAALVKAWLILTEFMHLPRLWRGEGAH